MKKRGYIKHENKILVNKGDLRDILTNGKGWLCLNPHLNKSTEKLM